MSESCDEECEVYEERFRTARKEHRCSACKRAILPGHRYCTVFALYDGNTTTYKRCGSCQRLHEHLVELCREASDDLWPRDDLGCGLKYESEWGDLPPEIAALAFMSDAEASALLEDPKARMKA